MPSPMPPEPVGEAVRPAAARKVETAVIRREKWRPRKNRNASTLGNGFETNATRELKQPLATVEGDCESRTVVTADSQCQAGVGKS